MDKEQYAISNNEKEQRFEIHEGEEVAYLEYRYYKTAMALMHTLVPEVLNGKGVASALAHYALEWAREHKKPVIVYCPFVAAYLKRHPEYNDIIENNYRQQS
jgi:predicted GNAT family acetyltransferase